MNSPLLISQVFFALTLISRKSREIRDLITFYNVTYTNFTKNKHTSTFGTILTP